MPKDHRHRSGSCPRQGPGNGIHSLKSGTPTCDGAETDIKGLVSPGRIDPSSETYFLGFTSLSSLTQKEVITSITKSAYRST